MEKDNQYDLKASTEISDTEKFISEESNLQVSDLNKTNDEALAYAETFEKEDLLVPEGFYRGERVYLSNIDQIGQRAIETTGHKQTHN